MLEIFRNPFFYIILGCVLVFLYALFLGRKKKKKNKKDKGDKSTTKNDKSSDVNEDVKPYEEFKNEIQPLIDANIAENKNEFNFDEIEVKPFDQQANDFFNDDENQKLFDEFFGSGSFNPFGHDNLNEQPIDYKIHEYDYNKVWEEEPQAISFDYDNYDVNYERAKNQSRIKKQLKRMNKTQRALLFANILEKKY